MEINYLRYRPSRHTTGYRIAGSKLEAMLKKLNMGDTKKENRTARMDQVSLSKTRSSGGPEGFVGPLYITAVNEEVLNKLNEGNYTQIGEWIKLDGGIVFKESDVPKLDVESLGTITAKDNVMDFGSANYFKYIDSKGKTQIFFSCSHGALDRPVSEDIIEPTGFDRERERYVHFWNGLGAGYPFFQAPNDPNLFGFGGYSSEDLRGYLDEAGISKGFFTVKMGMKTSELFYSSSEPTIIYKKEDYDFRYYTMTSPDFSYEKSVFRCLEPGTEIPIGGEKYILKEDLTIDIPYGIDIFDIQFPKHTHADRSSSGIDVRA